MANLLGVATAGGAGRYRGLDLNAALPHLEECARRGPDVHQRVVGAGDRLVEEELVELGQGWALVTFPTVAARQLADVDAHLHGVGRRHGEHGISQLAGADLEEEAAQDERVEPDVVAPEGAVGDDRLQQLHRACGSHAFPAGVLGDAVDGDGMLGQRRPLGLGPDQKGGRVVLATLRVVAREGNLDGTWLVGMVLVAAGLPEAVRLGVHEDEACVALRFHMRTCFSYARGLQFVEPELADRRGEREALGPGRGLREPHVGSQLRCVEMGCPVSGVS